MHFKRESKTPNTTYQNFVPTVRQQKNVCLSDRRLSEQHPGKNEKVRLKRENLKRIAK